MRKRLFIAGSVLVLPLWTPCIWAEEFTVDQLADAVDTKPGDGKCSTAEERCTLRAAVQEANALAGADVIVLPAGTYPLSVEGVNENKAQKGDLDITEDLTLQGEGSATTLIDGLALDRILEIFRNSAERDTRVEISGVTLVRGALRVDGAHGGALSNYGTLQLRQAVLEDNIVTGINGQGGALCNRGGSLTLEDVTLRRNKARLNGGGFCNLEGGTVHLNNVQVTDNATDQDGSSHHHGGALVSNGTLIVRNSVFAQNRSYYGGGAFLTAGLANFDRVTFENNRSVLHGGGLHAGSHGEDGTPAPVDLTITRSQIIGNELTDGGSAGHGGGLFITGQSVAYISDTEISKNSARGQCFACTIDGGGIYNDTGDVTLNLVRMEGNSAARFGGGVYNNTDRRMRIVASTLRDNRANRAGGGVAGENSRTDDGTPTTTVEHSLIAFNRAANGGGVAGSVVLRNSTLWGNVAFVDGEGTGNGGAVYIPEPGAASITGTVYLYRTDLFNVTVGMNAATAAGAQLHNAGGMLRLQSTLAAHPQGTENCSGRVDSLDYNIHSDASCALDAPNDSSIDPLLEATLADHGGPTLSAAPAADSPAIAAVAASDCPALDQRLFLRGAERCDTGAVELDGPTPASGVVTFATATRDAPVGEVPFVLEVERRNGIEGPASVDYIIRGGAVVEENGGTPSERGTLMWQAGEMKPQTLTVTPHRDGESVGAAVVTVELRNPVGAALGESPVLTLNIVEAPAGSDTEPTPEPGDSGNGESAGVGDGGGGGSLAWFLLPWLAATRWRRFVSHRRSI